MKKKLLSVLLCLAMTMALIVGCSSSDTVQNTNDKKPAATTDNEDSITNPPVKVTLNEVAHSIFYAPMYVAIEEGYFKDEGIDLTLVTGFGVLTLVQK